MAAIDTSGFQPRTLDKVERLLDLLDEMQRHPDLKGKLAMHGGTAINLFMLDIPRLSVDIDILTQVSGTSGGGPGGSARGAARATRPWPSTGGGSGTRSRRSPRSGRSRMGSGRYKIPAGVPNSLN